MFTRVSVQIKHTEGLSVNGTVSVRTCRHIELVQKIIRAILYLGVRANVPLPVGCVVCSSVSMALDKLTGEAWGGDPGPQERLG